MSRVTLDDVVGLARYAELRDEFRRRVISVKRHRRVAVGDRVTFVFENFATVLFQIQEMLHAERISDLDRVREELAVYNELMPDADHLSATMLIEITDVAQPDEIMAALRRLIGIDEHTALVFSGDRRVPGKFEPGRSTAEKLSAVQYVRFPLDERSMRELARPAAEVALVIDHPNYHHQTVLPESVRESLARDLRAEDPREVLRGIA